MRQRQLAWLSASARLRSAIEANSRQAGPKLQQQLMRYLKYDFEDFFEVALIDPDTKQERVVEVRH